jgi:glycosyltransferase involved in cell wall biosynthesis
LNGIDPARFDGLDAGYAASRLGLDAGVPLIFSAARANAYKGIPELIRAAAGLRDAGRTANWIYCGAGPDLDAFRAEVERRSLAGNFLCLGERDDVAPLLASSSVAVVPSTWEEAFGLTVVEAMAAGVPVVATRVGGIPEIVRDGVTGRLVPPGDEAALAAAIAEILDQPGAAAGRAEAARREVRTRFTVARVADELAGLLARARRTAAA